MMRKTPKRCHSFKNYKPFKNSETKNLFFCVCLCRKEHIIIAATASYKYRKLRTKSTLNEIFKFDLASSLKDGEEDKITNHLKIRKLKISLSAFVYAEKELIIAATASHKYRK